MPMPRTRAISQSLLLGLGIALPAVLASGCSNQAESKTDIGVSALLFTKRAHTVTDNGAVTVDVAGGNGQVIDYNRYVPGGSLNMLKPARADG